MGKKSDPRKISTGKLKSHNRDYQLESEKTKAQPREVRRPTSDERSRLDRARQYRQRMLLEEFTTDGGSEST
jgi:hypothetical protein